MTNKLEMTTEQTEYVDKLFKRVHKMSKEEQIQAANNLIEITGIPRTLVQNQIVKTIKARTFKARIRRFSSWIIFPFIMFRIWVSPRSFRAFKEILRHYYE